VQSDRSLLTFQKTLLPPLTRQMNDILLWCRGRRIRWNTGTLLPDYMAYNPEDRNLQVWTTDTTSLRNCIFKCF